MKQAFGALADFFRTVDKWLLSFCIAASVFGALMVLSATNYTGSTRQFWVQMACLLIGLVALVLVSTDFCT